MSFFFFFGWWKEQLRELSMLTDIQWTNEVSLIFHVLQNAQQIKFVKMGLWSGLCFSVFFYVFFYMYTLCRNKIINGGYFQNWEMQRLWHAVVLFFCCFVSAFQTLPISWAIFMASDEAPDSPLLENPTA